jgi:hypothetical protein
METQKTLTGTVSKVSTNDGFAILVERRTGREYMLFLDEVQDQPELKPYQVVSFVRDEEFTSTLVATPI